MQETVLTKSQSSTGNQVPDEPDMQHNAPHIRHGSSENLNTVQLSTSIYVNSLIDMSNSDKCRRNKNLLRVLS